MASEPAGKQGGESSAHDGKEPRPLGEVVARYRKRAGLSQDAMAERMREVGAKHWRQTTVSRVENGTQSLDIDETRALARVLGADILLPLLVAAPDSPSRPRTADLLAERLTKLEQMSALLRDEIIATQEIASVLIEEQGL